MISIELATGTSPSAGGQESARSTFALSTRLRTAMGVASSEALQFVLVPTLNGVENLPG